MRMLRMDAAGAEGERRSDMTKKKSDKQTDLERLHQWLASIGGNISLGASALKSSETSKSGDKLTIVLKKPKRTKKPDQADAGQPSLIG
jgi:hypothetical protein